jgi:MFS family permease
MIGVFVALGSVAGPGVGGMILQILPWSYIFWVNVPIGIFAIIMGEFLFPKEAMHKGKLDLDWGGTILFFLAISLLFLGVEIGQNTGFAHPIVIGSIIVAVILLVLFIRYELGQKIPMIDLHIFKNSLFSISLVAAFLIFVTNFFAAIIMPFYLQDLLKWSPGQAGLMMMVFPITMMIVGPIGGWMGDKLDKEIITSIGIIIVVLSQLGYTRFNAHTAVWELILFTVLNSAGTALFQASNNALVMSAVEKRYLGVAGSVNALARNLGMITGISIATTTLFTMMSISYGKRTTTYVPGRPDIFLTGMHTAFLVSFALAFITFLIVAYRLITKSKHREGIQEN